MYLSVIQLYNKNEIQTKNKTIRRFVDLAVFWRRWAAGQRNNSSHRAVQGKWKRNKQTLCTHKLQQLQQKYVNKNVAHNSRWPERLLSSKKRSSIGHSEKQNKLIHDLQKFSIHPISMKRNAPSYGVKHFGTTFHYLRFQIDITTWTSS